MGEIFSFFFIFREKESATFSKDIIFEDSFFFFSNWEGIGDCECRILCFFLCFFLEVGIYI